MIFFLLIGAGVSCIAEGGRNTFASAVQWKRGDGNPTDICVICMYDCTLYILLYDLIKLYVVVYLVYIISFICDLICMCTLSLQCIYMTCIVV